ncbi:Uncharacterized protein BC88300_02510 [Bacillus cytotoxicus]|nr:Uncharacterized protein BC88300_02510 [Bacillus cytotoxicus]
MEVLMNSLQLGQTYEISYAYVGMTDKVPTRVIVHRLTDEQQQKLSYKRKKETTTTLFDVVWA